MTPKERVALIDNAIDEVLSNLQNGIEIKEYWIDNLKVSKRSPLELITELRKIRALTIKDATKQKAKMKVYIFGDRY
ncbi:hypothetical protein [Campylobacter mucosalis]|uniref:Uncharacterized protein n=1 Tax=Campylobacter mucosalis CCUG 21559 TaxID=1032067 RepID=A0A6G5QG14_9BACT|nr:hypothetical protein [Campylobacter mucosalis]QCD44446.1 hypothetical protein CMUC_0647 [Campylobacter mucosalis CCUG 21559]